MTKTRPSPKPPPAPSETDPHRTRPPAGTGLDACVVDVDGYGSDLTANQHLLGAAPEIMAADVLASKLP
mgnify:FL=1